MKLVKITNLKVVNGERLCYNNEDFIYLILSKNTK